MRSAVIGGCEYLQGTDYWHSQLFSLEKKSPKGKSSHSLASHRAEKFQMAEDQLNFSTHHEPDSFKIATNNSGKYKETQNFKINCIQGWGKEEEEKEYSLKNSKVICLQSSGMLKRGIFFLR
mmetsp:Transcript_45324/g.52112  ORF Transcript_45324/g.52112 Transcript_45324/m.52112 type:complete len:122 (+) Transcript_45324:1919-2284(+)